MKEIHTATAHVMSLAKLRHISEVRGDSYEHCRTISDRDTKLRGVALSLRIIRHQEAALPSAVKLETRRRAGVRVMPCHRTLGDG